MANTRNNEGYFDPTATAAIAAVERTEALQRRKATAFVQIRREIELLDNEDQRDILVAFFLARRPMHAIADAQHLSLSSVYRIRKDAIQNLRVLLAKDLKSQEK